jgi:hypothetical protein
VFEIVRDPSAWEIVWSALQLLDRDHHDVLRALLDQCCAMTTEFINGNGGLYEVLTSAEVLENDVAAEREDRRAAQGFVSPADARAFLALARRGEQLDERDPITRAYFRNVAPPPLTPATPGLDRLVTVLAEAGIIGTAADRPLAALASETHPGSRFEAAMRDLRERDAVVFAKRVEEIGYLVNVMIAGTSGPGGRALRPMEALDLVLRACEAGLGASTDALCVVEHTPLDRLFRRGFPALPHVA